jgi:glutamyl-tRNA(Gln) amidotransferase subunit E
MAGLEVHQQLFTERKMFCHCPARRYTRTHDGEVFRHMRPTLSELGEYDGTALMEFKTKKNIIYLLHKENVCTYEMDDTPPFLVNQEAIDIAIEQCLMLGCDIVDEVHIARKQYLDGSIPTGFQRTAIVGVNGRLPFRGREITITQVSVEEDSCREVSDQGHLIVWRTDRLGMPLIETVTGPDLRTPGEVAEAILLVGLVCRSTGHVRVGIGASRQDVNVSVRGGRRVEIKGVPQAGWALRLVHGEAVRQVNLLRLRDELRRRGFSRPEDVAVEHADVTEIFASSALTVLRRESWERWVAETGRRVGFELRPGPFCVRAARLRNLAWTLAWPTQPHQSFASELAGRVRVISGLDQTPIIFHSESWPQYAGGAQELRRLRSRLHCESDDAAVIMWGTEEDTRTAADEIRLRYLDALDGVPHETRQPFPDGRTDFERILPGPDRMYPDTDSPPTRVTRERVERLRSALPMRPWEREAAWGAAGVPRPTMRYLIRRKGALLVDQVVASCDADLRRACFFFGERLKGLRRAGVRVDDISAEQWCEFFTLAQATPHLWQAWEQIVRSMAASPEIPAGEIVVREGLGIAPERWREMVREIAGNAARDAYDDDPRRLARLALGRCMRVLRGKVPAAEVASALSEEVEAGKQHVR